MNAREGAVGAEVTPGRLTDGLRRSNPGRVLLVALVMLAGCGDDPQSAPNGHENRNDRVRQAPESARAAAARPVRVAVAGAGFGRCEAIGRVSNLPGGDDDFLAVREAASARSRELDRLQDGMRVHLCARNDNGRWLGVVYQSNGKISGDDACRLRRASGAIGAYDGPCRSGWVSARYMLQERRVADDGRPLTVPRAQADEAAGPALANVPDERSSVEALLQQASDLSDRLEEITRQDFSRTNARGTSTAEYEIRPNISVCRLRFTSIEGVEGRQGYRQTQRVTEFFGPGDITDTAAGTGGVYGASYLSLSIADSADGAKAVQVTESPFFGPIKKSRDNQIDIFFPSPVLAEEAEEILSRLQHLCGQL